MIALQCCLNFCCTMNITQHKKERNWSFAEMWMDPRLWYGINEVGQTFKSSLWINTRFCRVKSELKHGILNVFFWNFLQWESHSPAELVLLTMYMLIGYTPTLNKKFKKLHRCEWISGIFPFREIFTFLWGSGLRQSIASCKQRHLGSFQNGSQLLGEGFKEKRSLVGCPSLFAAITLLMDFVSGSGMLYKHYL